MQEPLRLECLDFLSCIEKRRVPLTDGRHGIQVVRVLEKAQRSLKLMGNPVAIEG